MTKGGPVSSTYTGLYYALRPGYPGVQLPARARRRAWSSARSASPSRGSTSALHSPASSLGHGRDVMARQSALPRAAHCARRCTYAVLVLIALVCAVSVSVDAVGGDRQRGQRVRLSVVAAAAHAVARKLRRSIPRHRARTLLLNSLWITLLDRGLDGDGLLVGCLSSWHGSNFADGVSSSR